LEREFKEAERIEESRQKEEMEMRVCVTCLYFNSLCLSLPLKHRVQRKRFLELERTRRLETLEQLRADQAITHEIIDTMKSPISMYNSKSSISARSSKYVRKSLIYHKYSTFFNTIAIYYNRAHSEIADFWLLKIADLLDIAALIEMKVVVLLIFHLNKSNHSISLLN